MSYFIELLNEVRSRPGMYIGTPSVTKLASFLRGYDYAILKLARGADPFLNQFRDWIQQRYGTTAKAWEELILSDCADEAAAFQRFWELLDEYPKDKRTPAVVGSDKNDESADAKQRQTVPST